MSTIMKALDRLDKERSAGRRERPLREEIAERHVAPPARHSPRRALLIAAAGAGVAILAIGLLFVISGALTRASNETRGQPSPAAVSATREVTRAPSAAPRLQPPARERPDGGSRSPLDSGRAREEHAFATQRPEAQRPAGVEIELPATPLADFGETGASAAVSEVAVIELAVGAPPGVDSPGIRPRRTPAPGARERAAPEPTPTTPEPGAAAFEASADPREPEALASAAPAPAAPQRLSREVSAPARTEASTKGGVEPASSPPEVSAAPLAVLRDVRITRTIWHPSAERRYAFVEVSGQAGPLRVREGDLVAHLGVKRIEPWGVVFLDDGIEIEQRVGDRN